jgi:hypothetical protein
MWGRYAILGLVLAAGGGGASLALQQPVAPSTRIEPVARPLDPDASAEAGDEAADPFAQFDLGVAPLAQNDTVSEWTGLAASGLVLVPETVEIRAGQTVDALLIERGVRPDPYARSLVAEINPNLSEGFALSEGDSLTLFQVRRPDSGPFAAGRIALQPFQAERDAVRTRLEELAALTSSDASGMSELDRFQSMIARAQRRVVLTDSRQINAADSMLRAYNAQLLGALANHGSEAGGQATYAAVGRLTQATVAEIGQLPNDKRRASIRVRMRSTGAGPSGLCEVGWAPLGFATHKSSRVFEHYEDDVVIRVPASALHVWIARSQDAPATAALRRVQKAQLIDGQTVPMTIPTTGQCAS